VMATVPNIGGALCSKLEFLLRFNQNVEHKLPTGAYPLRDFHISHDFPIKVWGAYYTSVRIIFEFLR